MTKKIIYSIYILFLFSIIFIFPKGAYAATLNAFTDKQSVGIGDEFSVNLKIDTEDQSINAAQVTVKFSKDILEVVSVSKTDSIFNFWVEDPFIQNQFGTLSFTAGSVNGFSGKSLQALKIVFKVKGSGPADITLIDSAIILSDGTGINVLSKANGIKIVSAVTGGVMEEIFEIPKPTQITRPATTAHTSAILPQVEIPLYPDQNVWSNISSNFLVTWELPSDISSVSTAINHDPTFSPSISEGLFDSKVFPALDNGIWYMHVRFKNGLGWGATRHYKIAVDTFPPLPFEIKINEGNPTGTPNPTIVYSSSDQFSSLALYVLQIDSGERFEVKDSSYQLPLLPPGDHKIIVRAEDKAQNTTEGILTLSITPIDSPIISFMNVHPFVGEGNLYVSGTSLPGIKILFSLKNQNKQVVYSTSIDSGAEGAWTVRIDEPLKKGAYHLEIIAEDEKGARSFPAKAETIRVTPRPLVTFFGVGITQSWFLIILIIILGGVFIAGKISEKRKSKQRELRIVVAGEDIAHLLKGIRSEIENTENQMKSEKMNSQQFEEAAFSLQRIKKSVEQVEKYILKDIKGINR